MQISEKLYKLKSNDINTKLWAINELRPLLIYNQLILENISVFLFKSSSRNREIWSIFKDLLETETITNPTDKLFFNILKSTGANAEKKSGDSPKSKKLKTDSELDDRELLEILLQIFKLIIRNPNQTSLSQEQILSQLHTVLDKKNELIDEMIKYSIAQQPTKKHFLLLVGLMNPIGKYDLQLFKLLADKLLIYHSDIVLLLSEISRKLIANGQSDEPQDMKSLELFNEKQSFHKQFLLSLSSLDVNLHTIILEKFNKDITLFLLMQTRDNLATLFPLIKYDKQYQHYFKLIFRDILELKSVKLLLLMIEYDFNIVDEELDSVWNLLNLNSSEVHYLEQNATNLNDPDLMQVDTVDVNLLSQKIDLFKSLLDKYAKARDLVKLFDSFFSNTNQDLLKSKQVISKFNEIVSQQTSAIALQLYNYLITKSSLLVCNLLVHTKINHSKIQETNDNDIKIILYQLMDGYYSPELNYELICLHTDKTMQGDYIEKIYENMDIKIMDRYLYAICMNSSSKQIKMYLKEKFKNFHVDEDFFEIKPIQKEFFKFFSKKMDKLLEKKDSKKKIEKLIDILKQFPVIYFSRTEKAEIQRYLYQIQRDYQINLEDLVLRYMRNLDKKQLMFYRHNEHIMEKALQLNDLPLVLENECMMKPFWKLLKRKKKLNGDYDELYIKSLKTKDLELIEILLEYKYNDELVAKLDLSDFKATKIMLKYVQNEQVFKKLWSFKMDYQVQLSPEMVDFHQKELKVLKNELISGSKEDISGLLYSFKNHLFISDCPALIRYGSDKTKQTVYEIVNHWIKNKMIKPVHVPIILGLLYDVKEFKTEKYFVLYNLLKHSKIILPQYIFALQQIDNLPRILENMKNVKGISKHIIFLLFFVLTKQEELCFMMLDLCDDNARACLLACLNDRFGYLLNRYKDIVSKWEKQRYHGNA
ncbi:hypothetical protein HK103_001491 [Boothiomyces macroporosus]|uniref:Uncharacterized protein n=1 Tax=Boothiomyces macroporosus TaxID=261099 RepID=A0AAD5Y750_9FUNG|nr:hypothetical protein HK103_001491 [Boothiomyces macroporosus]